MTAAPITSHAGSGTLPAASAAPSPLPLISQLGGLLEESGVAYCHWKSNAAIDRSLRGENDLDLLVGRTDVRQFAAVLAHLGFARTYRRHGMVPGIESFYGFDFEAGRLVHVHAHYQLVIGDDRTKNYRLPIEEAYLRSATQTGVFRLPSPEFEYVVFVIRMILKYCTWDEILWSALRGTRAGPKRSEREEFEYLRARTDEGAAAAVVRGLLPCVDPRLFDDCVEALVTSVPLPRRVRTARRLEMSLQPHARRGRWADCAARIAGRVALATARRTGRSSKNRFASGGAMVAVMGGDGSGKSTALASLSRRLGSEFDLRVVHMGKPPWSVTTYVVRAGSKVAVLGANGLLRLLPIAPVRRFALGLSAYRPLIWLVCTARDRHRVYHGARRFATNGGLVLCDRYPHPCLTSMDVPRIASLTEGRLDGHLVRAMIQLEEHFHSSILPPELLIVLRVSPEIAVRRKPTEPRDMVSSRSAEVWGVDWRAAGAHVIDASRPAEAVAREVEQLVWATVR